MEFKGFRFDRLELAGSLGDLGTLLPLSVAMILLTDLQATPVFLLVGLFYVASGLYYRLPIPVQPLKVVAAIAIASPEKITLPLLAATGLLFGLILLLLAWTGIIDWLARFFTRPIVRGIQLGLGLLLVHKGLGFLLRPELFLQKTKTIQLFSGLSLNLVLGLVGFVLVLFLLGNKRFPSALVLVLGGVVLGVSLGALQGTSLTLGPTPLRLYLPGFNDFWLALVLLVLPQIPLTLGNAVIGTAETCTSLFGQGEETKRCSYRAFATSMGLINLGAGLLGSMPICHGAGGLAAHYRFGARTGGSNLMIGVVFLLLALLFGQLSVSLLSSIPYAVLGVLLLFAGLELALLIKDVSEKNDLFVVLLIASVGFATTNMGLAFATGIVVSALLRWRKIIL